MSRIAGIVYLIMGLFSVLLGYDIYLQHQTQLVTASYYRTIIDEQQLMIDNFSAVKKADDKFIKEHIEDIYKLSTLDSIRGYVTMDTLIRVFHYAKPHKAPVWNCPECSDIRKKGLPNKQLPGGRPKSPPSANPERTANVIQSPHRHDENLEGYKASRH